MKMDSASRIVKTAFHVRNRFAMDTTCRTCTRRDEFQGVSVNSISESHQEPIYLMLIYCTQLQFSTNDTFPQQICPDCLVLLEGAFTFWKQCRLTDANFRFGELNTDVGRIIPSIKPIAVPEAVADVYHCCIPKCSKVATKLAELEEHAKEEHFLKRRGFELRRSRSHAHVCSVCLAGFETLASWEVHQMILHGECKKSSDWDVRGDESSDSDEWPEQEPAEESFEPEKTNEADVGGEESTGGSGKKKRKGSFIPRGGQVLCCNGCGYQSNKKYNMARHQQVWKHEGVTCSTTQVVNEDPASEPEEPVSAAFDSNLIQFVEVPVKIEPTPNEPESDGMDVAEEEQQANEEKAQHQCAYCGMILYSRAKKLRHLQFSCTALHKPTKSNPKQCPKCKKKFNSTGLARHMQFCSLGNSRKECPNCGRAFNKNSNLNRHINLGYCTRKKFQCKFCLAWYGKNAALTRHLNNGCPKAGSVVESAVEQPTRSDSPCQGRVECPHCYSRFTRHSNLKRHLNENCHVLQKRREVEQLDTGEGALEQDGGVEGSGEACTET